MSHKENYLIITNHTTHNLIKIRIEYIENLIKIYEDVDPMIVNVLLDMKDGLQFILKSTILSHSDFPDCDLYPDSDMWGDDDD